MAGVLKLLTDTTVAVRRNFSAASPSSGRPEVATGAGATDCKAIASTTGVITPIISGLRKKS
jgi:hypothetical protein